MQQHFDAYADDSLNISQTTVVQFDKDNNRDTGDMVVIATVLYPQIPEKSSVYYAYSANYQEPILLVHLRPPNT